MFGSKNTEQPKPAPVAAEQAPVEKPTDSHLASNHGESESNTESGSHQKTGRDVVLEGLKNIGGLGSSMAPAAGKSSGVIDESKWCALCERDGHESIDCPFDE
jgi:hypothetical protein